MLRRRGHFKLAPRRFGMQFNFPYLHSLRFPLSSRVRSEHAKWAPVINIDCLLVKINL